MKAVAVHSDCQDETVRQFIGKPQPKKIMQCLVPDMSENEFQTEDIDP